MSEPDCTGEIDLGRAVTIGQLIEYAGYLGCDGNADYDRALASLISAAAELQYQCVPKVAAAIREQARRTR